MLRCNRQRVLRRWPPLWIPFALGCAALVTLAADPASINPPLGPYVNLDADDFAATSSYAGDDRLVLTPYFYWYDVQTSAHIVNADGSDALTDHPATLAAFSYRSKAWHKSELQDMLDAGVDVLLPVYWGEPSQRRANTPVSGQPWSYAGLPPLVAARDELLAEGQQPPKVGMFYDTSTLEYNAAGERIDLTTDRGRRWFYESIRDFYSLIPPRHWAMIDDRPVIFLYSAAFAAAHDQTCIDYLRQAFARDFGGRVPYVVREISWKVSTEQVYAWGGALGLRNPGVASLGPGYDHSAVPGRTPLVVSREGGAFFERNWTRFLNRPSQLVMIETWNEFHEGTEIAASREYGRQYIGLNRKYADLFKAGVRLPRPRGPYSDFRAVTATLETTNLEEGLDQTEQADGITAPDQAGGQACRRAMPNPHGGRYIYFRIDDSFKWADTMLVEVAVEYFDLGSGRFRIEYDGSDLSAPFQGAYTASPQWIRLGGTSRWKTATFRLPGSRFLNSQNGGSDLRINVEADPFRVRRVEVVRLGVPEEAGRKVAGWQADLSRPFGSQWEALGATPGGTRQTGGLLELDSDPTHSRQLRAKAPGESTGGEEILARLRACGLDPGDVWSGGVSVALDTSGAVSFTLAFEWGPAGRRQLGWAGPAGLVGPRSNFTWTTNQWYWVRVKHAPTATANAPDLWGRVWPADGETPEPDTWTSSWDYYPAVFARRGISGLSVSASSARATLDVDFFLVRLATWPEVQVRPPAPHSARAYLGITGRPSVAGFELVLRGEPHLSYWIESTPDFRQWSGPVIQTDATGVGRFGDPQGASTPLRFYRARASW